MTDKQNNKNLTSDDGGKKQLGSFVKIKNKPQWNYANLITFSRLILVCGFLILFIVFYSLYHQTTVKIKLGGSGDQSPLLLTKLPILPFNIVFLTIFILAVITDILDGYVARRAGISSKFGKLTDPLIDKLLINFYTFAIILIYPNLYPIWWALIIFLFRDFLVDWGRMVLAKKDIIINANFWGKAKTFFQSLFIVFALINLFFQDLDLQNATIAIAAIASFISLFSGMIYLIPLFKEWKEFCFINKE